MANALKEEEGLNKQREMSEEGEMEDLLLFPSPWGGAPGKSKASKTIDKQMDRHKSPLFPAFWVVLNSQQVMTNQLPYLQHLGGATHTGAQPSIMKNRYRNKRTNFFIARQVQKLSTLSEEVLVMVYSTYSDIKNAHTMKISSITSFSPRTDNKWNCDHQSLPSQSSLLPIMG